MSTDTIDYDHVANAGQQFLAERAGGWDIAEYGNGQVVGGVSSRNKQAWHGLLIPLPQELLTMEEAFEAYPQAGLEVTKEPVWVADGAGGYKQVPRSYATVRADGRALGTVGERYKVFQNRGLVQLGQDIMDLSGAGIETMVETRNGARFFVVFNVPKDIKIAGLPTERLDFYLMLSNSHDTSMPLRVDTTLVRSECENSQIFAIKNAPRSYVLRHTSSMDGRINEIRAALGISFTYTEAIEHLGSEMVAKPLRGSDFSAFLNKLVPLPEDQESRGFTMRSKTQDAIREIYKGAENLEPVRNTRWAALQSVVEYWDHGMTSKTTATGTDEENRFHRIMLADGTSLPNRALALLT